MRKKVFAAYPNDNRLVKDAISESVGNLRDQDIELSIWEKMNIYGFKIDDLIREEIVSADLLVADITFPNLNVFYEIGYAVGSRKPILPTVNSAINGAAKEVNKLGLFDSIGFITYENCSDLSDKITFGVENATTLDYIKPKNHSQPLYILDCLKKTDFRNHIINAVTNANLKYRSFDPSEMPRITAAHAIAEVSASAGIIIPLLAEYIVDSKYHNLRAAFLLGLSHGFNVEALMIQYENLPAPLDYRDFIKNSTFKHETEKHIEEFAKEVLIWNQNPSKITPSSDLSILTKIDLGSAAAENEFQKLGNYFIETAQYTRASRAESAIVIGRKGAGKSAIYFHLMQNMSKNRNVCLVDLRPASHNLSEMREALIDVSTTGGVFQHTIAAFWQFILYSEVLLKIREILLPISRNDYALQQKIRDFETEFKFDNAMVSGDFTSRLEVIVQMIITAVRTMEGENIRQKITNLMFEKPIPSLRDTISGFSNYFDEIVILVDDLDKGWPPLRVEVHDVTIVRHLVDELNRINRDMKRRNVTMRNLVFLRSDVYEQLVSETADRGKYNVIRVDWSDPEQLRHLLRVRIENNLSSAEAQEAWHAVNDSKNGKEDYVSIMIEHSLRRPRFLIDLCEQTISTAINRGHGFVTEEDVNEGLKHMSLYLVSDFGYEVRDIAGTPAEIFYGFIGSSDLLLEEEVKDNLLKVGVDAESLPDVIKLLVWYGFLGIVNKNLEKIYIYDRAYDIRRLDAERNSDATEALYCVNQAFLLGLGAV